MCDCLNANTKEILRSVAKEEINGVVKESLIDEVYEEEELELEPAEMGGEEEGSEEDGLGDIEGSEEEPEMGSELGMNTDVLGGAEMDMTAASDDDVIAIYKKLSGEDEIEIVGDEIHLNISEPGEYIVKTGGKEAEEEELELEPAEMGGEEEESDDVEYEIEMGDEEEENEIPDDLVPADEEGEEEEGEEEEEEVEALEEKISVGTGMSVGTHRNKTAAGSIGASENPKSMNESLKAKQLVSETTKKYNTLLTEARKLKTENEEFRSALREFRTKLVETVVFNSNLTYVTKLFLEHSTTKTEKDVIIKRFDEATNLKESKKLYKTIGGELESRKPINESLESKIIKEATTSTSKQLNESTAYVDPSTKRIMDLINRVEKR